MICNNCLSNVSYTEKLSTHSDLTWNRYKRSQAQNAPNDAKGASSSRCNPFAFVGQYFHAINPTEKCVSLTKGYIEIVGPCEVSMKGVRQQTGGGQWYGHPF